MDGGLYTIHGSTGSRFSATLRNSALETVVTFMALFATQRDWAYCQLWVGDRYGGSEPL